MNFAVRSLKGFLCILVLLSPAVSHAWSLFGDSSSISRSGLDLIQGYDRNTVTTLTGQVVVEPNQSSDPVALEIVAGSDRYVVVLGPRWYLQDDILAWKNGDTVTVRGSKAQGKDGRIYLLTQSISTSESSQMVLRSDTGRPDWSGGGGGGQQGGGGMQQRSGGGGGGGGMRRGR